ncbi:MAG: diguanylate cyclase [Acidobacteria bacterium]|nr:diguanylate cyclase [Acidobacteriota bacterium]
MKGLKTAALLHDIGNLAVPESILSKPGSLTPEELERLKIHPNVGAAIVEGVPFPYPVAPLIRSHHERWDGTGYPQGLKGDDIPLAARVLAIADSYTTLMSERPYRAAYSHDEAVRIVRRQSGSTFDPKLLEQFLAMLPELRPQLSGDDSGAEAELTNPLKAISGAHREERILFEIAQALGSTLSLDDTMALVCARLADLIPFTSCGLFLIDQAQSRAFCRYTAGPHMPAIRRIGSRSIEEMLATLPLSEPHERVDPARDLLATRLQLHNQTIGALVIYDTQANRYTPEHRRVFERVARQATSVIYNSLTFERTQEESVTDPLTGLPNRRHLTDQFDRILTTAGRTRRPVGLLMMDLDGVRQINDGYGHHVGDRALRQVGVALRSFAGSSDLCVRYAGDEFVIVLANSDAEQVQLRAKALQDLVADLWFEVQPGMRLQLAANVGTAVYPQDGLKSDELLETADARMYRQKVARRAQKRVATQTPVATPPAEVFDLPVRAEDAQSALRR